MAAPLLAQLHQAGLRDPARNPSREELELLLAARAFEEELASLREQQQSLLQNEPPRADNGDERAADAHGEWELALNLNQASLLQAHACYELPLDHKFGEQTAPPPAEHWLNLPGVRYG